MTLIGINTWVWTSPLRDVQARELLAHVAATGFDVVELPLEQPGDLTVAATRAALDDTGLQACVVGAMGPGRDLVGPDDDPPTAATVRATQDYLRACVDLAHGIGATSVCGPFSAATGRTWRMTPVQREQTYARWRDALEPVVEHAADAGVRIGIEPLNRYETSLVNTTQQALTALGPLLDGPLAAHVGLALDTYHLNIEERSSSDAIRLAGEHLVHVQVCGNDRGAPGGDQTDWPAVLAALTEVGYAGPLVIESFTADNDTIATAASIWRPLAPTQDALAADGLAFLRSLTATEGPTHD